MSNLPSEDPPSVAAPGSQDENLAIPSAFESEGLRLLGDKEKFRLLADTLPQIVWITRADGYHEYYNKHWWSYTGLTYEQARGEGWNLALHPDDVQDSVARWNEALQTGEPYEIEYRIRRASDGQYRWFLGRALPQRDEAGNIVRWFGTCTDIHAQKQAEAELRQSSSRLQIALEAGRQATWEMDLVSGVFNESDSMGPLYGQVPGTKRRRVEDWCQQMHPDDREPTLTHFHRAITERGAFHAEYRVPVAEGQVRWIESHGRVLPNAEGKPIKIAGVAADITGRKQAEAEREELLISERAARAEAERINRLKDEFLSNLSHELRTPLNAILGWSQVLRLSQEGDEDLEEGLSVIERNARVQTQLVDDLLDMSRIISGKMRLDVQPVDLRAVIEAALESVRPAAEAKEIRLQTVLDPQAGPVMGDPARLQQVVWNLLSNAIKFTPKSGRVQAFLERVNSHVEIIISDTGAGIKPEFLPHVFERFRQADATMTRKHGGLGLGLAIVKNLTEMHGGGIRAKSLGEHQGATFVVHLPLSIAQPPEEPKARQHPRTEEMHPRAFDASPKLEGVRVLVVDDEADGRSFVKRLLEECGASVAVAGSAAEGLETLRRMRPDVLISDIGMPEQDGYQFLQKVRDLSADEGGKVAAIALTAFARSEDRRRAMLAGFDLHMAKPVEPAELLAVVARLAKRTG